MQPAPGRALRARAAATDRASVFEDRLAAVRLDVAQRERRAEQLRVVRGVGLIVTTIVLAFILASFVDVGIAAVSAVVLVAAIEVGRRLAGRAARGRGAEAWDWQAGRHRLMGKPAADVQQADQHHTTGPRGS
ncbi:MAG: hypothetical protein ACI867_000324 [Glaciecola sp.]|jgi:hypothetical protein